MRSGPDVAAGRYPVTTLMPFLQFVETMLFEERLMPDRRASEQIRCSAGRCAQRRQLECDATVFVLLFRLLEI
jgi:hypothetical protein